MKDVSEKTSSRSSTHSHRFLTTQWQLIRSASSDTDHAVRHLDRLLRRYLPALKQFLKARYSLDHSTIEDLLQSFIAARILHGRLLKLADPQRGRFRTVLLSALTNHVKEEIRKSAAAKRIPSNSLISWDTVDEADLEPLPPTLEAENSLLHSPLNHQILGETVQRFQQHCNRRGKLIMWEVFEARLLKPMLEDSPPEPYEALQSRLHLKSHNQATNLLMTAKRSIIRILREVVGEYALNVTDAEIEFCALKQYCGFESGPTDEAKGE